MKEKQQRQQIDLLEANEKELAKKNHSNQKVRREIQLVFFCEVFPEMLRTKTFTGEQ